MEKAEEVNATMSEPKTVLIVEDNAGHRLQIEKAFRRNNAPYRLDMAPDLKNANEYLAAKGPDIIVVDYDLPDGYGTELLSVTKNQNIPLVMMTCYGDEETAVGIMKSGALDYVVKSPSSFETLPHTVKNALEKWEQANKQRQLEEEIRQYNRRLEAEIKKSRELAEAREKMFLQLKDVNRRLAEANRKLERLANYDALTGLANRRNFMETLEGEWKRARRLNAPLGLLMIDVDHFKAYNDTYGHPAGDTCLNQVADLLRQALERPGDFPARYGGEEFAAILPGSYLENVEAVAEKIRAKIEAAHLPHSSSPIGGFITVSLGAASVIPDSLQTPDDLVIAADKGLYKAKENGRNRCERV